MNVRNTVFSGGTAALPQTRWVCSSSRGNCWRRKAGYLGDGTPQLTGNRSSLETSQQRLDLKSMVLCFCCVWLQNSPLVWFLFLQSDCSGFVLFILFTPLFLPTSERVFHPENQLFDCLGRFVFFFFLFKQITPCRLFFPPLSTFCRC